MAEPILGILTFQGNAYREIADDPGETLNAGLIVLGVALVTTLVPLLLPGGDVSLALVVSKLQEGLGLDHTTALILTGFGRVLLSLAQWIIFAWLLMMIGFFVGGAATMPALLRVLGYISLFDLVSLVPVPGASIVAAVLGLIAYFVAMREVAGVGWLPALGMGCLASFLWPILLAILLLPLVGTLVP
jgi:hypothetical protein